MMSKNTVFCALLAVASAGPQGSVQERLLNLDAQPCAGLARRRQGFGDMFQCSSGEQIPASQVCDGVPQCGCTCDESPEVCGSDHSTGPGVTNPGPSPVTNPGPSPTGGEAAEWLKAHNVRRCMHGVGDLQWSDAAAADAEQWVANNGYQHNFDSYDLKWPQGPAGENLFMGTAGAYPIEQTVASWYDEIKDCASLPGCEQSVGGQVGHFTAMVWAGATHVGCASVQDGGNDIRICRYLTENCKDQDSCGFENAGSIPNMSAGNSYQQNVLPAIKSQQQCA